MILIWVNRKSQSKTFSCPQRGIRGCPPCPPTLWILGGFLCERQAGQCTRRVGPALFDANFSSELWPPLIPHTAPPHICAHSPQFILLNIAPPFPPGYVLTHPPHHHHPSHIYICSPRWSSRTLRLGHEIYHTHSTLAPQCTTFA